MLPHEDKGDRPRAGDMVGGTRSWNGHFGEHFGSSLKGSHTRHRWHATAWPERSGRPEPEKPGALGRGGSRGRTDGATDTQGNDAHQGPPTEARPQHLGPVTKEQTSHQVPPTHT